MNFGNFDRRLLLQRPTSVPQNDFGEPAPASFEDVETVYGEQKPGAGAETFLGQQLTAQQAVTWQIRYRADLATTWQFTCEGQLYQIIAIQEIGRRAGLLLSTYSRGAAPVAVVIPEPEPEPEPQPVVSTGQWLSLTSDLATNAAGGLFSGDSAPAQPAGGVQRLRLGGVGSWFQWQLAGNVYDSQGVIISLQADPTSYVYNGGPMDFSAREKRVQNGTALFGVEGDVDDNSWIRLTRTATDDITISVSTDGGLGEAFRDVVTRPGVIAGIANPYIVGKVQGQANRTIQKTRGFGLLS